MTAHRILPILAIVLLPVLLLAQKPAWIQGSHVVDFRDAYYNDPISYPLPIPTDVGPELRYFGQVAIRSQYVQLDDLGRVLFFIIDGRIYDRKGYLIADNQEDGDCVECVPKGVSEVAVLQVPDRCGMFYIFTSVEGTVVQPYNAYVSVLDLEAQNLHFAGDPGKRGLLLTDLELDPLGFSLYIDWSVWSGGTRHPLFSLNDELYGTLHIPDCPGTACNGVVHMEAVDGADGQDKFFLITSGHDIVKWRVTATTMEYLGADAVTYEYPLGSAPEYEGNRSPKGEFDAWRSLDGNTLKVAVSLYSEDGAPPSRVNHIRYYEYTYDGVNLTVVDDGQNLIANVPSGVNLNINGDDIQVLRVSGLEFSPNGEFLLFLASVVSGTSLQLGYIDLGIGSASWYASGFLPFVDSEIELAIGNGVAGEFVAYLAGYDPVLDQYRFGAYRWPNNPSAGLAYWEDNNYTLPSATDLDPVSISGDIYHLLMNQAASDQSDARLASEGCCAAVFGMTAEPGYQAVPGFQNWTSSSNPFGSSADLRFNGDLVVPAWAEINVYDMTFHFGTEASLVVEPGGKIRFFNSTLTSGCPGDRWKGAEVRGNSALAQLPTSNQGYLYLHESTLENAETGIVCAELVPGGGYDADGYGGIVRTHGATFRNNIIDTDILGYRAHAQTQNLCQFTGTDFVTDGNWPDAAEPIVHARLELTNMVKFTNCRFRNLNAAFAEIDRGYGIQSFYTTFRVLGNNIPSESYFEGLYCGVMASKGRVYSVKDMDFRNTTYGIVDMQFHLGWITGNTFHVPEFQPGGASPIGLLLFQTDDYVAENNTFSGDAVNTNAGIVWLGPLKDANQIYNNNFDHVFAGTLVIGNHQSGMTDQVGLQKLCGDYTDNTIDYGMGPDATISGAQGVSIDPNNLAGNRFFNTPDCGNTYDMAFDVAVPATSFFNYYRHDDSDCDVICEEPLHMADIIPFLGLVYDEATSCGGGFSSGGDINIGTAQAKMLLAGDQFKSALASYNGTVDQGETPDLIEAINDDSPWWPSHELRDLLLLHHPLSDDVLAAIIGRGEPMDAWHITQVFIQNAKLNPGIVQRLRSSELVNAYFMALIDQAQQGAGPGVKQLLEQEIHLRGMEHQRARLECLLYWSVDTLAPDPEDSLLAVLENGIGVQDSVDLLLHHLYRGNAAEAAQLKAQPWYDADELVTLREWISVYEQMTGSPPEPAVGDLTALETLAESGQFGSSLAWATLLEVGHWQHLPTITMPSSFKALWNSPPAKAPPGFELPMLAVHPNPAGDRAFATYRLDDAPDALLLYSPQGQAIQRYELTHSSGVMELDLERLSSGPYLLVLERAGTRIAQEKLTVLGERIIR